MATCFGSPTEMVRYADTDEESETEICSSQGVSKEAEQEKDMHDAYIHRLKSEHERLKSENEFLRARVQELEVQLATVTLQKEDQDLKAFNNRTPPRGHSPRSKRVKTTPTASPKKWHPFTGEEDENIVSYLKRPGIRAIGINSGTWELMKNDVFKENPHPPSALENRFRKKIIHKIESFFDTREEAKEFLKKVQSPRKGAQV